MELTQELVKSLFDYKEGALYWKIQKARRVKIGDLAGSINTTKGDTRHMIRICPRTFARARIIFLWHNGWLPSVVDHENRNSLDDRIENLRAASLSQNGMNRASAKNATSKYLGVCFYKATNRWRARINIYGNGDCKHIGFFKSEGHAALAYNRMAVMHHKEFANLNIIQTTSTHA